MASFIIHTLSAEYLLKEIENEYGVSLSTKDTNNFILGNLIVDSLKVDTTVPKNLTNQEAVDYKMELKRKIRKEKINTHFRNMDNEDNVLKIPEPQLFIKKYKNLLVKDISVIGYLFHLYTDRLFFSQLFPQTFISLKCDGTITTKEKESHSIRILKNEKIVSDKVFWTGSSPLSIYSDYTILNKLLLEHFGTSFDSEELLEFSQTNFNNPGIEEVDYNKINEIILKIKQFIEESYKNKELILNVFEEELVKEFIQSTSTKFLSEYGEFIKIYLPPKQITLKKEN